MTVDIQKYFHGEAFTEDEGAEIRSRIYEYAKGLIDNQDYVSLQRLTARLDKEYVSFQRLTAKLSCDDIDRVLSDYIIVASAASSDIALIHAFRFIEHAEAMTECGKSWRG